MIISELIKQLERAKEKNGDIEVTCTASTNGDSKDLHPQLSGGCFESTVENLQIQKPTEAWSEKRLRLYW